MNENRVFVNNKFSEASHSWLLDDVAKQSEQGGKQRRSRSALA